jgi:Protein of unknown function (DUF3313)
VNLNKSMRHVAVIACVASGFGLACSSALLAADAPPEVTQDGLHLRKSTKSTLVYVKPGATLGQYGKVAILDCLVEFDKSWQRDYNSSATTRVTDSDMDRIKKGLADQFKKVFTKELTKGGYQVVDSAAPDVLVLRPAIVNLRVTAPDLMTAGISRTVVRSAGSMTLYLELWDSVSNTILARAMDAQSDDGMNGQVSSRVTNTSAADSILRRWADILRDRLDAARAAPPG